MPCADSRLDKALKCWFHFSSSTVTKLLSRKLLPSEGWWWWLIELMMWKSHLRSVLKKIKQQNGIREKKAAFPLSAISLFPSLYQEWLATDLQQTTTLIPGTFNLLSVAVAAEKWILISIYLFIFLPEASELTANCVIWTLTQNLQHQKNSPGPCKVHHHHHHHHHCRHHLRSIWFNVWNTA